MGRKMAMGVAVVLGLAVLVGMARAQQPGNPFEGQPLAPAAGARPNPFGESTETQATARHALHLGTAINGKTSDFGPIIAPDGNSLFFTSDRPGGLGGQDVWVSTRKNGVWQPAKNLGPPINTRGDEGPDSFSLSENALYFTACDREFGQGGCDIYVSFRQDKGWSVPENLGAPVNTAANETNASISSNGDMLIFTSDRAGGQGGADLWAARRGAVIRNLRPGFSTAGRWEEPVNLGPNVNTPDWDGVGFLMPDNETLYFSSRGRGGAGADIFQSILRDGQWSPARNMGEIINTARDEIYFTLPGSGDLAYFSSDMAGGRGMEDIYSISIPLLIPQSRLVILRGKVKDEGGAPVVAAVRVVDPSTARVLSETKSDPTSGSFNLVFNARRVSVEIIEPAHQVYKETIEIVDDEAMSMLTREIALKAK